MKIHAKWYVDTLSLYRPKRCVIPLLSGLPFSQNGINSLNTIKCQVTYAMGVCNYNHYFAGGDFVAELNEVPIEILVSLNNTSFKLLERPEILKLSAKAHLRLLVDLVLADNPSKRFCR